jgi:uncharacterized protein (TIGR02145 family)
MYKIIKNWLPIMVIIVATILTGCKKEKIPVITTTEVSDISPTTATSGGNITDEGSSRVLNRGVCWSTGLTPTIADKKTTDGTGPGSFSSNITGLNEATVYYVRAYATNTVGTGYGITLSFTTSGQSPTATVAPATNIDLMSATLNGSVNANYFSAVVTFEYGITTSYDSTVTAAKSPVEGNADTHVSADISGLTAGTIYHYRIKAVNSLGTTYSDDITFTAIPTDIDGNVYKTVTIGTQLWMTENLRTTKYRNGDLIGTTTPASLDISGESMSKYQWAYNGNESNVAVYGRLYTWYAVTDSRNICPTGWHVPSDADWTTLLDYLTENGYGYGGSGNQIAKSMAATSGWTTDATAGNAGNDLTSNNSSGFTALPSGDRYSDGAFFGLSTECYWWSIKEFDASDAWGYYMYNFYGGVFRNHGTKQFGISVRCLHD